MRKNLMIFGWAIILISLLLFLSAIPRYIQDIQEGLQRGRTLSEIDRTQDFIFFILLHLIGLISGIGVLRFRKWAKLLSRIFITLYAGLWGFMALSKGEILIPLVCLTLIFFTLYFFSRPRVKELFE